MQGSGERESWGPMIAPPSPTFFGGRSCLVAGGTGFIGSHCAEALLVAGARVRLTVHRRPPVLTDPRFDLCTADLSRREDCLRAMDGIDTVIHAAGGVGAAGVGPQALMVGIAELLTLTANLLWAAWTAGVRRILIFSSSTGYPAFDHPVREDEFWTGPVHPAYYGYGWMRRYLERQAEFVAQRSNLTAIIVRPGAVYGPRDNFDPATSHVLPALIRRAVAGDNPFVVWGTGDEVRDLLHVSDFARGCLLALEKAGNCDPVNIAGGEAVTVRTMVSHVLTATGRRDVELRFDAGKPVAIPVRRIDTAKALQQLGFTPVIGLAEGVADTVRWFRDQPAVTGRLLK